MDILVDQRLEIQQFDDAPSHGISVAVFRDASQCVVKARALKVEPAKAKQCVAGQRAVRMSCSVGLKRAGGLVELTELCV